MTEQPRTIQTALEAIRDVLAALPTVRSCEIHRGRFRLGEIGSRSFRTPALRLALGRVVSVSEIDDRTMDVTLRFNLALVTTDERQMPREVAATALINELMLTLPNQQWDRPEWLHQVEPDSITADNLFTGDVERQGIMLWEVTWQQAVRVTDSVVESGQLKQLFIGFAPEIGAAHRDAYFEIACSGEAPDV